MSYKAAYLEVARFMQAPGTVFKLNHHLFAKSLLQMIDHPDSIDQDGYGFCGIVAALRLWAARDPFALVRFALELYRNGWAKFGEGSIKPCQELVDCDFADLQQVEGIWIQPAVWLLASAIQDFKNLIPDFEGRPNESFSQGLDGYRVQDVLQRMGMHHATKMEAKYGIKKGIKHALALQPGVRHERTGDVYTDVILCINADMLKPSLVIPGFHFTTSNHYIGLNAPLKALGNDMYELSIWSWGKSYPPLRVSKDWFETFYFGAITAETFLPGLAPFPQKRTIPSRAKHVRASRQPNDQVEVSWAQDGLENIEWYEIREER